MIEKIEYRTPISLIGGGPCESEDLTAILSLAPVLIAADGGADRALAVGHRPDLVIGDMDSISPSAREAMSDASLIHVPEQDSTDFGKCLARVSAPVILAIGFLGARVDHGLAALSDLAQSQARCILLGAEDVVFAAPRRLQLDLPAGTRLSLFPMARVTGRSSGLKWPIDGIGFEPLGRIGTSNAVTGPVSLTFDGDGMLVILPRAFLTSAIAAISTAPAA